MFAFIVLAFSLKEMTLRDIEDFGRNPHEDTEIHTVRRSIRNHEGRHVESPFQKNGDPEGGAGDDAVQLWVQCQKAVQFHKRQYERTGKIKYELPEDTPGEEFPKVKPSKKKSEKMESKKAVRTEPLEETIS